VSGDRVTILAKTFQDPRRPSEEELKPAFTEHGWGLIHGESDEIVQAHCPDHASEAPE
jgi:hypothetical protein